MFQNVFLPQLAPGAAQPAPVQPAPVEPQPAPKLDDTATFVKGSPDGRLEDPTATPARVVAAMRDLVETAFKAQDNGVMMAFAALERRPEVAPSWMMALIGTMAEMVIGVGLGQIAALIGKAVASSEGSTKVISSQMARVMSGIGKSAGHAIKAAPDATDPTADVDQRLALGSDRLIDEYHAQVDAELLARQGTGKAQLTLSSDTIAALPARQLAAMLDALEVSKRAVSRITVGQQMEVMWGWMRLNAGMALGPPKEGETQMPGANGDGAHLSAKEFALSTVAGLDGFVDIFISCPETVDGLKGCKVERVVVNAHPAVATTVRESGLSSLLELPVHRKVFISSHNSGGRHWAAGPSFVLTPTGETEVLHSAKELAAIGSGLAGVDEMAIKPWIDKDDGTPPVDARPKAEFQHAMWLIDAQRGAELVKDLLGRTAPKDVVK